MATPEKALIDILYLTPAKSNLFKTLPEVELLPSFNHKKAYAIINKITLLRIKALVQSRLESLLAIQTQ